MCVLGEGRSVAQATLYAFNLTRQSFLSLSVTRAENRWAHLLGPGRRLRADVGGLWLDPSRPVHTFGLLHPIDVIYLDAHMRVVHLIEYLSPFRIARPRRLCTSILKLPPRSIFGSGTQVGDSLVVCTPEQWQRACQLNAVAQPMLAERAI